MSIFLAFFLKVLASIGDGSVFHMRITAVPKGHRKHNLRIIAVPDVVLHVMLTVHAAFFICKKYRL
jgi:hypothetical protein